MLHVVRKATVYTEEQRIKRRAYTRAWTQANPGYRAEWRRRNREKVRKTDREHARAYRLRFPERVKAWKKADVARRKDAVREAKRLHYRANAETIKAKVAAWRKANPERKRQLHRAYKKRHPEKVIEQSCRRRVRMLSGDSTDCSAKISILKRARFCHWCCDPIISSTMEIDHVTPLSRGGLHHPDNLVAACKPCNRSKRNRLVHEWTWKEAA